MKVLLIDSFDSFSYILYDYIKQLGHSCSVIRNDVEVLMKLTEYSDSIVLSPGPGRPQDAGYLMKVVEKCVKVKPVLGVCLGHQALGVHFGMQLVKAETPMHGIPSNLSIIEHPLFDGIENGFSAMRYHSLLLNKSDCKEFDIIAKSEDQEIMMMQHKKLPVTGMQFHPESILTFKGLKLLDNWFRLITKAFNLCAIFFYITLF